MIKPEDLKKMTPAQRDKLKKAELAARQKAQMNKSKPSTAKRPKLTMPTAKSTAKPKAKKPTLDDFLLKGKKPPMKIKPGLTRPSDADVILKGYNDKKTINKYKKGK
jgi:hypothetical protein